METTNTVPSWMPLADEALKRAAQRAREIAIQTNTGICVMQEGKIVRITADELRAERARQAVAVGDLSAQTTP